MHNESQGSLGSLGGIGHQRDTLGGTACLSITENPAPAQTGPGNSEGACPYRGLPALFGDPIAACFQAPLPAIYSRLPDTGTALRTASARHGQDIRIDAVS